jgi:hypothetical protein
MVKTQEEQMKTSGERRLSLAIYAFCKLKEPTQKKNNNPPLQIQHSISSALLKLQKRDENILDSFYKSAMKIPKIHWPQ